MALNLFKILNSKHHTFLSLHCCNQFHTSACWYGQAGKAMRKVLGLSSKKKRRYTDTLSPSMISPSAFSKGTNEGKPSVNSRRSTVLNKLFMRHITDLMANGENCTEFLGHGIEINRVKIAPDYRGLNVYWVAAALPDTDANERFIIENLLRKNAGYLRHELSTLKVMGAVPAITFIKDKQYAQIVEVDVRLARADFGDDHIPTKVEMKLKAQLELMRPLNDRTRERIKELDQDQLNDELNESDRFVIDVMMPQDVFGLNHADILNRVRKSMRKSRASHRITDNNDDDLAVPLTNNINAHPIEFPDNNSKREAFRDFLQQRERLRVRAIRDNRNYQPDLEYLQEEFREREMKYFENMNVFTDNLNEEENDYLSDDDIN